jgi:hypothetical protein
MAVTREFRRALASVARSPALLGLAVLLAVFRPPPALRVVSYVYLFLALLTFVLTPVPMAALLGASDRTLREQPTTDGLVGTVKDRYLQLLAANGAISAAFLGLNFAFGILVTVLVLVVGIGAAGVGALVSPSPVSTPGAGGSDGLLAGLGVVAIAAYALLILAVLAANTVLDVLVRFAKPAVVVGEASALDALSESYGLVRAFPRVALGYYAVQRAVGLCLGALVVVAAVGLFSVGSLVSNPLSGTESGVAAVIAVVLAAYAARSITYAVTLPYTVNVYQYLRYRSGRTD